MNESDSNGENLESCTIKALLASSGSAVNAFSSREVLPKFSAPLKVSFENRSLWLRFGITLSLSKESSHCALQAFHECLRIDQYDPLPAMLGAKLLAETMDDLDQGIKMIKEAIKRCSNLLKWSNDLPKNISDQETNGTEKLGSTSSVNSVPSDGEVLDPTDQDQPTNGGLYLDSNPDNPPPLSDIAYQEVKPCYKRIRPILSRCYLLASIMHAHIYEKQLESMKEFHEHNLSSSLSYLELSFGQHADDHLLYFHKALHKAKKHSHTEAIEFLRQAIKLKPNHVPSIRLLLLSLSALKRYEEALVLCDSALHEFENDLLLLYIKCNLECCLGEAKGHKMALNTIQQMLRCFRKSSEKQEDKIVSSKEITLIQPQVDIKQAANLFGATRLDKEKAEPYSDELSIWLLAAEIYIKIGHIDYAEQCVDESSSHTNGILSHEVMFFRGLIAKAKKNLIEAKSFFQSCLALSPRHARALQQIAHVYFLLGNFVTAEKFIRDSLDLDSDCYITWQYLGSILIELNQHEMASECNKRAESLEASSTIIPLNVIPRLTLE